MPIRLLLAAGLWLAWVPAALAHAVLLETKPAEGAALETSPDELVLVFNEPVTPVSVRIVDAAGRTVAGPGGAVARDDGVRLAVGRTLPPGRYIVAFRVASADTHPISGALRFSVGADTGDPSGLTPEPNAETGWTHVSIAVRFARDAALALGIGGIFFATMFARTRPRGPVFGIALGVAATATMLGIGVAGARLGDGAGLLGLEAWRLGAMLSAGPAAVAILAGIAAAAAACSSGSRWLATAGAVFAAAGTALTGHAATGGDLAFAAQSLHSLSAWIWLGAFWPLYAMTANGDAADLRRAARRFSTTAIAVVLALAAAALWLAATRVPVAAPAGSAYGQIALFKTALLASLLAVAVANRRLVPLLESSAAARVQFRRHLRIDVALGLVLVGATAILTHTPPPSHEAGHHHPLASGMSLALMREGYQLTIDIDRTAIDLYLAKPDLSAFVPQDLTMEIAQRAAGIEALKVELRCVADGHYRAHAAELVLRGRWSVRVDALIDDFKKLIFETELELR